MQKVEGRVLGAFSASPRGDSDGDGVSDQQQTDGSEKGASKARKNTRPKLTEADLFEGKIGARGLDSLRKRSVSARGGLSRGPNEQDDVSIRQDLNQPKKRAKANGNTTEKEAAANIRRWRAAQLNSQLVGKAYRQWGSDVAPALTAESADDVLVQASKLLATTSGKEGMSRFLEGETGAGAEQPVFGDALPSWNTPADTGVDASLRDPLDDFDPDELLREQERAPRPSIEDDFDPDELLREQEAASVASVPQVPEDDFDPDELLREHEGRAPSTGNSSGPPQTNEPPPELAPEVLAMIAEKRAAAIRRREEIDRERSIREAESL